MADAVYAIDAAERTVSRMRKARENAQDMEKIYREYAQTVYRYLFSRTGDEGIAEEITQETFYQAVRNSSKFNGSCSVLTWLCAIAKNKLYEYYRKNNRELSINDDTAGVSERSVAEQTQADRVQTVTSAEAEILASESRVELMRALRQLAPDVREVIYMRLFGELSFREIGEVVGRSENWARVTYYRGKERLRKNILQNDSDMESAAGMKANGEGGVCDE